MDRPIRDEENPEQERDTADDRPQPGKRPGRKKAAKPDEFNPTSGGDERGEVL